MSLTSEDIVTLTNCLIGVGSGASVVALLKILTSPRNVEGAIFVNSESGEQNSPLIQTLDNQNSNYGDLLTEAKSTNTARDLDRLIGKEKKGGRWFWRKGPIG